MLNRFKYKAIQKKISRSLNRVGNSDSFRKIDSVLVLTDATQSIQDLPTEHLASLLGINPNEIKTVEFTIKKNKKQELLPNQISKESFSIQGNFKGQAKPEILKEQFKLVIAYYQANSYLDGVLLEQQNAFKAGLSGADGRLLDLVIASPLDKPEIFINELVKYLQVLQLTLQYK